MTKSELLALLARLHIRPSRKRGQNFLIDPNLLNAIVNDAGPTPGETILEVGPGAGALTCRLLDSGVRVVAIEQDRRLCEYLRETFGNRPNFVLVHGDAVTQDYDAIFDDAPYRCVSNLPYAVSSPFIARLLLSRNRPRELYLLLQKETAQRLAAKPCTKAYGALCVLAQLAYSVQILRSVPPAVFYPAPEVASAHVAFTPRTDATPDAAEMRALHCLVRRAFSQRRKQLGRLLEAEFDRDRIRQGLHGIGLPVTARAEQLTPDQFRQLARIIVTPLEKQPKRSTRFNGKAQYPGCDF